MGVSHLQGAFCVFSCRRHGILITPYKRRSRAVEGVCQHAHSAVWSVQRCTIILLLTLMAITVSAQNVTNVSARQVGNEIEITYDLDKAADITVLVSTSMRESYWELQHVTGDVGKTVGPGHKTVVWNVRAELEELIGDNISFMVRVDANAESAWRAKQRKQQEEEIAQKKAQEKEAKEREKALEKEAKEKEQSIKREERREKIQSIPYSTFLTLDAAYGFQDYTYIRSSRDWSYGFKVGQMKVAGWYVNLMTNFHFKGWNHPFEEGQNYWLSDRKAIRFSAQAGLVIHPCKPLSLLFGVGYGYRTVTYKTNENEWFSYPSWTLHGVDASLGLLFDIKGFVLTAEVVTTHFKTIEARMGLGYCFPTGKKYKNQTVKELE